MTFLQFFKLLPFEKALLLVLILNIVGRKASTMKIYFVLFLLAVISGLPIPNTITKSTSGILLSSDNLVDIENFSFTTLINDDESTSFPSWWYDWDWVKSLFGFKLKDPSREKFQEQRRREQEDSKAFFSTIKSLDSKGNIIEVPVEII